MFVVKFTTIFFINVAQHTLYDIRDNKPYTVRKLADGNCWMTDNLALNLGTPSAPVTVKRTRNNSTQTEDWTPTGAGGNNTAEPMNNNTKTPAPNGNYYYSWYAATAGSGTYSQINTEAEWSICPSGWKLPANYTIDPVKSYGSLTNAYGLTIGGANVTVDHIAELESSPLGFIRAGGYSEGKLYNSGTYGNYWSSTAINDVTGAYLLNYLSLRTQPQAGHYKFYGYNVRCVAL